MAASAMCVKETPVIKSRLIYTKQTINLPKRIIYAYITWKRLSCSASWSYNGVRNSKGRCQKCAISNIYIMNDMVFASNLKVLPWYMAKNMEVSFYYDETDIIYNC